MAGQPLAKPTELARRISRGVKQRVRPEDYNDECADHRYDAPTPSARKSVLSPKAKPNLHVESFTVNLHGSEVTIQHDVQFQQVIRWKKPIQATLPTPCGDSSLVECTLAPGECNLYFFPLISEPCDGSGLRPMGVGDGKDAQLLITQLVLALALETNGAFLDRMDDSGATPAHGLLLANTDASVALSMRIFRTLPQIMPVYHGPSYGSASKLGCGGTVGPFDGEHALHVLLVNRRESAAIEMITLAHAHLDREGLG